MIKVTDMTSGQEWVLESGDLYQVGPNDRHLYEVLEDEHHLSIFFLRYGVTKLLDSIFVTCKLLIELIQF